jgi:hypothetical protein
LAAVLERLFNPATIGEGETSGQTTVTTELVVDTRTAVITAELEPTSASATLTIEPLAVTLATSSIAPSTVVGSNDATLP